MQVTVLYSHPLQKKDIKLSMGEIGYQAIDYERNWVPGEIGYQADLKSPQPKREVRGFFVLHICVGQSQLRVVTAQNSCFGEQE